MLSALNFNFWSLEGIPLPKTSSDPYTHLREKMSILKQDNRVGGAASDADMQPYSSIIRIGLQGFSLRYFITQTDFTYVPSPNDVCSK